IPLALAHASFRRLLRHRLVRKDPDPDLAAALEAPRQRDARGLDLAIRHPARLHGLEAVVAEGERRPARGDAPHPPALGLPVLDTLRHQHGRAASRFRDRKSTRLNSSHLGISYAVFCLKKKKKHQITCAYRIASLRLPMSPRFSRDVRAVSTSHDHS